MFNCFHGPILKQVYHKGLSLAYYYFFDLYNNLSDGLTTNARLFADDVSLFSVVSNINLSATNLNSDLSKKKKKKILGQISEK